MAPVPLLDVIPRRYPTINPKDEHVVAAAITVGADFVITLDQPLEDEINRLNLLLLACSPGEFINEHLVSHPTFTR